MKHIFIIFLLSAVCCLPSLFMGCGGQKLPADLPKLYPTVLTVIQDGKPLADALVTLVNVDTSIAWSCVARTDSSGRAAMQTNGMYLGAPAGTYKATVSKQESSTPGASLFADAPDPVTDQDAYQEWYMRNEGRISAAQSQQPVTYILVDSKFSDPSTSPLEVTITSGRNSHTLDVGGAIRELFRERPR